MIKKIIVAAVALIASTVLPANKSATIHPIHSDMISAFSDFPKGVQQIIVDYYGKYWVALPYVRDYTTFGFALTRGESSTTSYFNPHANYPLSISKLEFVLCKSPKAVSVMLDDLKKHIEALKEGKRLVDNSPLDHLALKASFAYGDVFQAHSVSLNCEVEKGESGVRFLRIRTQLHDNQWLPSVPQTPPSAISSCKIYKAYVEDFKLPYGGTKVRILKKEEDTNYAQLVAILALQDRGKEELASDSFDVLKEKLEGKGGGDGK